METYEIFSRGDPIEFKWHTASGTVLLRGIFKKYLDDNTSAMIWCEELETDLSIRKCLIIRRYNFEVSGEHAGS